VFDAARDLTEFRYRGETAFVLNSTLKAYDANEVGSIVSLLDLSSIDIDTPTGRPDIQVTAQRLDTTLNRHVVVASAPVSRIGAFLLYPLPLDEGDEDDTEYDLVVHGPGIQTIIVRDVPVSPGAPDSADPIAPGLIAPEPADSYEAQISDGASVLPAGARVGFYQTLPDVDAPYLVAQATVDPLRGRFAEPVRLSRADRIQHGTYGANFVLRSEEPREGKTRYAVAALSPHFGAGAFAAETLRPASQASDTARFTVPAVTTMAPAAEGTITVTMNVANPGTYDEGVLLVTHEGAIVTTLPISNALQQLLGTAVIDVTPVPAGTSTVPLASGLYNVEVWTWNSGDAEDTFERHAGAAPVDLREVAAASAAVTVD
jgi:hypothetical protein